MSKLTFTQKVNVSRSNALEALFKTALATVSIDFIVLGVFAKPNIKKGAAQPLFGRREIRHCAQDNFGVLSEGVSIESWNRSVKGLPSGRSNFGADCVMVSGMLVAIKVNVPALQDLLT